MRVVIDYDLPANMVDIYVGDERYYSTYGKPDEIVTVKPGERSNPYLSIDRIIWDEIMREALGPTPTDAVVQDLRNTRDRLLTLVEHVVKERTQ